MDQPLDFSQYDYCLYLCKCHTVISCYSHRLIEYYSFLLDIGRDGLMGFVVESNNFVHESGLALIPRIRYNIKLYITIVDNDHVIQFSIV